MRSLPHLHISLYKGELDIKKWFDTIAALEKDSWDQKVMSFKLGWNAVKLCRTQEVTTGVDHSLPVQRRMSNFPRVFSRKKSLLIVVKRCEHPQSNGVGK